MIFTFTVEMMIRFFQYFLLVANGVISVLSNIMPKKTSQMVHDFLEGNIEGAKEVQLQLIPLISALFSEVNPIPVKMALNLCGYHFGIPRLPLTEATNRN